MFVRFNIVRELCRREKDEKSLVLRKINRSLRLSCGELEAIFIHPKRGR